jgi:hypothetical protein
MQTPLFFPRSVVDFLRRCGLCNVVVAIKAQGIWAFFQQMFVLACVGCMAGFASSNSNGSMYKSPRFLHGLVTECCMTLGAGIALFGGSKTVTAGLFLCVASRTKRLLLRTVLKAAFLLLLVAASTDAALIGFEELGTLLIGLKQLWIF